MKSSNVPGYKDLFGRKRDKYENLLKDIPSELIIRVFSALNNELNGSGGLQGNQASIFKDLIRRFTVPQRKDLKIRINKYQAKIGKEVPIVFFAPRYFMVMILKELNHYRIVDEYTDQPHFEYNLFKAYLLVIDEAARKDNSAINLKALTPGDPMNLFRIMWLPTINQYEFNEKSFRAFEMYKTMCFFKYVSQKYRMYVKEFLSDLHFNSIGNYLGSFDSINKTIDNVDPDAAMLKRLNYIVPLPGVDHSHLKRLSANLRQQEGFQLIDIKKAPLCYAEDRNGYMVIDYNYANKKMFRGAFYEICHQTSLTQNADYTKEKKDSIFNKYSQHVSDAFEKNYFKPIMQLLSEFGSDFVYFDDQTPNIPDCYIRIGNKIILFEYKAYVFKEELIKNPDFDKLIEYLDEKFLLSKAAKRKGVGQLIKQIELLISRDFKFDEEIYKIHDQGDIVIFPVIIYNDFNFSLPGINSYLNGKLLEGLKKLNGERISVMPLVMLNLETIMDLAVIGKSMNDLGSGFLNYYRFLEFSNMQLQAQPNSNTFMRANMSFDEFYRAYLIEQTQNDHSVSENFKKLITLSGIDIDNFNQPL